MLMKSVSDERNRNNDPDILFCLILVDKIKQMNGEQKEVMQIEVLQAIELCRQLLMPLQPTNPIQQMQSPNGVQQMQPPNAMQQMQSPTGVQQMQ